MPTVIPMSGKGQRFKDAGYETPKPYLYVDNNKMMFELALESIPFGYKRIFIVNENNITPEIEKIINNKNYNQDDYNYQYFFNSIIKEKENELKGPATSVLLAKEYINTNEPLIICNCDHKIIWDTKFFGEFWNTDGLIVSFNSIDKDPKYSYIKLEDKSNRVIEIKEKEKISDIACAGIYIFKKGSDFVKYCEFMIEKELKINNEYYVSTVFDLMIKDGKNITNIMAYDYKSLGTPEEYIKHIKENWS